MSDRILVLRHGALGDFVLSFGPFAAIRAHHATARITLLTTAPFVPLARLSPWFDDVEVDARPAWWDLPGLRRLRRQLSGFGRVYDLQTSGRSSAYFPLAGRPEWSGIARGASHPHANPARDRMHTRERQHEQLAMAGIADIPPPDLGWLAAAAALRCRRRSRCWCRVPRRIGRRNAGRRNSSPVWPGCCGSAVCVRW